MDSPRFKAVADRALLIEFASVISDAANQAVITLDQAISAAEIEGVGEVIPALVNVLVTFDPLITDHARVECAVRALFPLRTSNNTHATRHELAVCYEAGFSPDLAAVAGACDLSTEAVINAHVSSEYHVAMYGFAPGYAYLSGVPEAIQIPRKPTAVRDVPARSVTIAGPQCLAMALTMPTGWSIIGVTPTFVMQDDAARPFLFDVGDTVVFKRIKADELPADLRAGR